MQDRSPWPKRPLVRRFVVGSRCRDMPWVRGLNEVPCKPITRAEAEGRVDTYERGVIYELVPVGARPYNAKRPAERRADKYLKGK